MTGVVPPDLEQWLCDYLRARLPDVPGLKVKNKTPPDYVGAYPLVTIRDDGGDRDEFLEYTRSIGVNVLGWNQARDKPCKDLARRVSALLTDETALQSASGSPVIAVDYGSCNGPYAVTEEAEYAHYYLIVGLMAAGEPID
ncbi:hypothetical protein [Bifidobacterium platyrrhinorum]|uniref:Uncharacterized protein n=1 Tax=Bifidobacterium platyrrhinorum TaxID=2661628 RepID=A0A6L9SWE4_9BIFI|nr:hypothetical protein [Bifidobacterium platyrrhinorum]NEG56133.1 hypothetical protein [Bifidobacterium platyrrhinorum]